MNCLLKLRVPALFSPGLALDDSVGLIGGSLIGFLHFDKGDLLVFHLVLGDEAENVLLTVLLLLPRICQSCSRNGEPVQLPWVVADGIDGRNLPSDPEQEASPLVLDGSQCQRSHCAGLSHVLPLLLA